MEADIIVIPIRIPGATYDFESAISLAARHGTLIFASCGERDIFPTPLFPATDPNVVGIFATDALGNPASFNPLPMKHRPNFTILGEVQQGPSDIISGTSVACAVAAGLAGCLLDFSRQPGCRGRIPDLGKRHNLELVLDFMSQVRHGYEYIVPWRLLEDISTGIDREEAREMLINRLLMVSRQSTSRNCAAHSNRRSANRF